MRIREQLEHAAEFGHLVVDTYEGDEGHLRIRQTVGAMKLVGIAVVRDERLTYAELDGTIYRTQVGEFGSAQGQLNLLLSSMRQRVTT